MVVPTQRGLFQDFLIDGDTHVTLPVIVFFSRFAGKSKPPVSRVVVYSVR